MTEDKIWVRKQLGLLTRYMYVSGRLVEGQLFKSLLMSMTKFIAYLNLTIYDPLDRSQFEFWVQVDFDLIEAILRKRLDRISAFFFSMFIVNKEKTFFYHMTMLIGVWISLKDFLHSFVCWWWREW